MPLEQTAATATPPSLLPLPPSQIRLRINPSPDVQQQRVLAIMPFAPVMRQFTTRAAKGALCGVALALFWLLLTLPNFATATAEQTLHKAFLFWSSTTPWAAGVFAVLFALSAVPGGWWHQALLAARPRVASRWSHRED